MSLWMIVGSIILILLAGGGYVTYRLGKVTGEKDDKKQEAEAFKNGAEITSKPDVDRPLGRMHNKTN